MNDNIFELSSGIISSSYVNQARQARRRHEKVIQQLLANRTLPTHGWDRLTIKLFLDELAVMDSNNFIGNVGVGEREGRVFSDLVADRYWGLSHGVGRSGDIGAEQPKAAGSSLLLKLTQMIALHAIRLSGISSASTCLVLPLATGMAHTLALLALKTHKPEAKYVIWPRMDQKTCFKSILAAGLVPLVIENILEGDELRTDIESVEAEVSRVGGASILCVLSTSSCFAPRAPDRIVELSQICRHHNIAHVVNNAYGLQTRESCELISRSIRCGGRIDCFIQSTDKNFQVPVGGAIIAGFDESSKFIDDISQTYPGRASVSAVLDLFITLISMGVTGYTKLRDERHQLFPYFQTELSRVAAAHGERLLTTSNNPISFGMTLSNHGSAKDATYIGSMLFSRCVSGTRTVDPTCVKKIGDITFKGYGAHYNEYPVPYLTAACAIGITRDDIDGFISRLDKCLHEFNKQQTKRSISSTTATPPSQATTSDTIASSSSLKIAKRVVASSDNSDEKRKRNGGNEVNQTGDTTGERKLDNHSRRSSDHTNSIVPPCSSSLSSCSIPSSSKLLAIIRPNETSLIAPISVTSVIPSTSLTGHIHTNAAAASSTMNAKTLSSAATDSSNTSACVSNEYTKPRHVLHTPKRAPVASSSSSSSLVAADSKRSSTATVKAKEKSTPKLSLATTALLFPTETPDIAPSIESSTSSSTTSAATASLSNTSTSHSDHRNGHDNGTPNGTGTAVTNVTRANNGNNGNNGNGNTSGTLKPSELRAAIDVSDNIDITDATDATDAAGAVTATAKRLRVVQKKLREISRLKHQIQAVGVATDASVLRKLATETTLVEQEKQLLRALTSTSATHSPLL